MTNFFICPTTLSHICTQIPEALNLFFLHSNLHLHHTFIFLYVNLLLLQHCWYLIRNICWCYCSPKFSFLLTQWPEHRLMYVHQPGTKCSKRSHAEVIVCWGIVCNVSMLCMWWVAICDVLWTMWTNWIVCWILCLYWFSVGWRSNHNIYVQLNQNIGSTYNFSLILVYNYV